MIFFEGLSSTSSSEKISDDDGDDLPEEDPDDEDCDEDCDEEEDANGPKRLLILLPHCLFLPTSFSLVCTSSFLTPSRLVMGTFDLVVVMAVVGIDLSSEARMGNVSVSKLYMYSLNQCI